MAENRANNALAVLGKVTDTQFKDTTHAGTHRPVQRGKYYQGDARGYVDLGVRTDLHLQNFRIEFYAVLVNFVGFEPWMCVGYNRSTQGFNLVQNGPAITSNLGTGSNLVQGASYTFSSAGIYKVRYEVYNGISYIYVNDILDDDIIAVPNIVYGATNKSSLLIDYNGTSFVGASSNGIFGVVFSELDTAGNLVSELSFYKCDENSGTVTYNSLGNTNHGTIVNAVTVPPEQNPNSIHQYQDIKSWQDEAGYSLSGSVFIPRNELIKLPPFKDILGNDLQYIGHVPYNFDFVNSLCWAGDGVAYYSAPGILATDTVEVFGNSDTPTISDGRLDLAAGLKCYGLTIKRGGVPIREFPFCEEIITAANHTAFDKLGNNNATLINGLSANVGEQNEYHDLQVNGFAVSDGVSYYKDQALTELIPVTSHIPAHATIPGKCVAYTTGGVLADLTHVQDGETFLNSGTDLLSPRAPELVQGDKTNLGDFFFDNLTGEPVPIAFNDIQGVLDDTLFADIAKAVQGEIKNIRFQKNRLFRGQLETEKRITNN